MLKRYIMDFAVTNVVTLAISFLGYFAGNKLIDTYLLILFLEGGLLLIFGGLSGFVLSSVLFWAFGRYFRARKTSPNLKDETEEKQSAKGKRFIILGAALLTESILLALSIM